MYRIFMSGIFLIFIVLRVIALFNVTAFEDHDSIQYLTMIRNLADGDFNSYFSYNPDKTFLFSILGIISYPLTHSIEISARLVSLISSIVLFFSVFAISNRLTNKKVTFVVMFLLAIHPLLINHSIGILTEPLYISIIYFGFYIFLKYIDNPSYFLIFILSIVFSLGFLNRTEGITFLAFIPAMLILLKLLNYLPKVDWKITIKSILIFVFLFCLFISPQIIRVSNQLGEFALNGRQVWQLVLHKDDGRAYNEKIRGLDYSSKEVNLTYLMKHPEERAKFQVSSSISNYFVNIIIQLKEFFSHKVFVLFGKIELLLLIIGLLALFQKRFRFSLLIILPFLGMVFVPPLLHDVDIRHILILVPLLILIISIGIITVSELFSIGIKKYIPSFQIKNIEYYFVLLIIGVLLIFKYPHVKKALITPSQNLEYNESEIVHVASFISTQVKKNNIVSIKTYLPFFAKGNYFPFPFAPYSKLVEYCQINNIDYLFMDYRNMKEYEVIHNFSEQEVQEFELVYSNKGELDKRLELYKFKKSNTEKSY